MKEVGMINVTSRDNYDYFFNNIEKYDTDSNPDTYYLKGNKIYYSSTEKLRSSHKCKYVFIPANITENDEILAVGNIESYEIVNIKNIINFINDWNIYELCNTIKLIKNYCKSEMAPQIILILKSIIKEKYGPLPDSGKDEKFYKGLLTLGLSIRGWKKGKFPQNNFETRYLCYSNFVQDYEIDVENCYLYHNHMFNYYGNNYNINNPESLSKLYISTSVFYIMNKFEDYIKDFSISTMI